MVHDFEAEENHLREKLETLKKKKGRIYAFMIESAEIEKVMILFHN